MSGSEISRARSDGSPLDGSSLLLPSDYPNHFAGRHGERLAIVCGQHRWTYAALDRACDVFVSCLEAQGVGEGDRFAYIGRNNDLFAIAMIGAMRAGAIMVPVNWRNTAAETRYVLEDSGTRFILTDDEFDGMVADADRNGLPRMSIDGAEASALRFQLAALEAAPRRPLDPHARALQLYTSGTTGKPKGVMTSQYALGMMRHAEKMLPAFSDWGDDEVLLSPLPCFHVGGLSWLLTGLCRGATVHVTADTTPTGLLDMCLAEGVTRTFMVPTLVRALIEEMDKQGVRVPTLNGIHYGAASMDPALLERSVDRLGCRFLQYYGMTEIGGSVTILGPEDHDISRPHLLRSVGRPLPGISIEIRGPDKQLLKKDEPGEIWVKGPSLFREYWNKPEATAEAIEEGWYRTGDGGRLNTDGYLFLTDRVKDMIVSGGENVYPAEVEAVLRDHPAVQDCAVFGLPHTKWGEGVVAAVELRPGMSATAEEIVTFARDSLAAYKIPRRIEFGVTLPRTASGKVQRGVIRKHFQDRG